MVTPENLSGETGAQREPKFDRDASTTAVDTAIVLLGAGVTAITHPLLYVKLLIQTIPAEEVENVSDRDDLNTSLRKVVKETSHEMVIQCLSRIATHPFHVISVRCMAQFVGREIKYRGLFSCIANIFKEEGVGGFFAGVVPHVLGEVIFLWCCNLLAHFINTYAVDNNFSQAPAVRSYTKFVMGIAVSVLTYPFMLVADLMAVNNCGLVAGVPPNSPIFKSWVCCWAHLSHEGHLFRGSSFFFRRVPVKAMALTEE
ncbi:mitochondrial carrier homolog 1 isoform X3 [Oncorhynchus mykiss]|uniref:mitochondrial carrier homolog 1 isoform X3 n=1 Tax=Oncorhynchus mykiss TaxID=8022 RepID=UPI0018788F70|nr:mitochondrial carrier homolog 1 isoform X3 [Oncorhynchus mykiss]